MYSILIKFPFSSSNDEQYELCLYCAQSGAMSNAISAMNNDKRCFKFLEYQVIDSWNVRRTYEGTLAGDVIAEDDDREDVFNPLVASKLKFNMACQEFPTWLMDLCNYYTNVKVVLYAVSGGAHLERWRGYLMANTLNMTTVDEMMACPLVAVDEIGIAKYLKFKENFGLGNNSPTLLELFNYYFGMLCISDHPKTSLFDDLYSYTSMTLRRYLLLQRDMLYYDSSGNTTYDLMGLTINLEKYLIDREATWEDVFSDICDYLGVTFQIGATDNIGSDYYILSDTNYQYGEYTIYQMATGNYTHWQDRIFADFGNQDKVGADFQTTYKPCEWKGVKVKSTPERPPIHSYLDNDNVRPIAPYAGHDEWCETRIGKFRVNNTIDDFSYRVFQYAEIVDKEDQWIPENKYVTMENCNTAMDARTVGIGDGYFPATDDTLGYQRPRGDIIDSMDFALLHWGMIPAKIGSYETPRQKVSPDLRNFFVILNNKWGRKYWDDDDTVTVDEPSPALIGTFTPFADDVSIRPSNTSYLTIDMAAMFLNENIGDDCRIVENGALVDDLQGKMQAVFPILQSFHDWAAGEDGQYTGNLTASTHNYIVDMRFQPVIIAKLSIGNHYWDGSQWVYEENAANAPTFYLKFVPSGATDKYWMVATGYMHGNINNYYYEECRLKVGSSDNLFRVPLDGLSIHGQPLQGKVKLEIYGRVPFVNGYVYTLGSKTHFNNILFVLLSDIRFEFTDDALLSEKNIDTVSEVVIDPDSTTKDIKDVDLKLSTPSVDGVFNNCLLYDNGKSWVNLQIIQNGGSDHTPEEVKAREMALVLCDKQVFVEFSRPFVATTTDNIYNVGFTVSGLTEASGHFMPLTRKFNWTKGWVRWKMQKVD